MKKYLALISLLALTACMEKQDAVTSTSPTSQGSGIDDQSGNIQLLVQGTAKVAVDTSLTSTDTNAFEFDLGTANSSIQKFFILRNTGKRSVENITLTTNNPQFYFSPSSISLLPASGDLTAEQVVVLNVVHGVNLNGVGAANLLPQGINITKVQITATTTNSHNDTVTLSKIGHMQVLANVVNIAAYDSITPIDLSQPSGSARGPGIPASQTIPYYAVSSSVCKLVNTGNVNIVFRRWAGMLNSSVVTFVDSTVVAPESTYYAPIYNPTGDYGSLQIDGQGTISDPKLEKINDGRIFLRFQKPIHVRVH